MLGSLDFTSGATDRPFPVAPFHSSQRIAVTMSKRFVLNQDRAIGGKSLPQGTSICELTEVAGVTVEDAMVEYRKGYAEFRTVEEDETPAAEGEPTK